MDWLRETLHVRWVYLDKTRQLRQYPKTSASQREVPVPGDVLGAMSRRMEGRGRSSLVFVGRDGFPVKHGTWWLALRTACEQAGVRSFNPHTLRHTCASWLVQSGVPLIEVMQLLGHTNYATVLKYAFLAPDAHRGRSPRGGGAPRTRKSAAGRDRMSGSSLHPPCMDHGVRAIQAFDQHRRDTRRIHLWMFQAQR